MGLDSFVRSLIPLPTTTTLMSLTRGYNNNLLDCFMGVVMFGSLCVWEYGYYAELSLSIAVGNDNNSLDCFLWLLIFLCFIKNYY